MGDLTRNFSRAEFDVHERYPDDLVDGHLIPLAERAQWLRDLAGSPGIVTSAWRSAARNAEIANASSTSQHMDGDAVDLYFPLASLRDIASEALRARDAGLIGDAPPYGQLIFYPDEGHVHVSLPAARLDDRNGQVLVASSDGQRDTYAPLTDPARQLPAISGAQKKTLASASGWHSSSWSWS